MAVVKNLSTERSREFWSHVERIAAQVRNNTEGDQGNVVQEEHRPTVDHAPDCSRTERDTSPVNRD
jgi:hypothetical protein